MAKFRHQYYKYSKLELKFKNFASFLSKRLEKLNVCCTFMPDFQCQSFL
jgi:hypothetical protein